MEGILYSGAGFFALLAALCWYLVARSTKLKEEDGSVAAGDTAKLLPGMRNVRKLNLWATLFTILALVLGGIAQFV